MVCVKRMTVAMESRLKSIGLKWQMYNVPRTNRCLLESIVCDSNAASAGTKLCKYVYSLPITICGEIFSTTSHQDVPKILLHSMTHVDIIVQNHCVVTYIRALRKDIIFVRCLSVNVQSVSHILLLRIKCFSNLFHLEKKNVISSLPLDYTKGVIIIIPCSLDAAHK